MPKRSGCPGPAAAPGGGHQGQLSPGGDREVPDKQDAAVPMPGSPEATGMGCTVWEPGGTLPRTWLMEGGREAPAGQGCGAASQPLPPSLTDPKEPQRPLAHECLGETLRILRQVINKYPLLNTLETLTAAGTLISKVKGETMGLGPLSHSPPDPCRDVWGLGRPQRGLPGAELPHGWAERAKSSTASWLCFGFKDDVVSEMTEPRSPPGGFQAQPREKTLK